MAARRPTSATARWSHRARPSREIDTGKGWTSSGSMPDSANRFVSRGPTRGSTTSPRLCARASKNGARFGERGHAGRRRAVPIPRGVVRLDREDAPAGARHPREFAQRFADVGDVLEHRDAERGIEGPIRERQMAGIGGAERGPQVVAVGGALGDDGAVDQPVDADEGHLRNAQPRQPQLDLAGAAADVENPVADAGPQPFDEERRERLVPPLVAYVFEGRGGQRIEGARRGRHGRLIYHTQNRRPRPRSTAVQRAAAAAWRAMPEQASACIEPSHGCDAVSERDVSATTRVELNYLRRLHSDSLLSFFAIRCISSRPNQLQSLDSRGQDRCHSCSVPRAVGL